MLFDDKPQDAHAQMLTGAKEKFGEDFHLSFRVRNYELRPFWECVCSRELCMCIHHLRFDFMASGHSSMHDSANGSPSSVIALATHSHRMAGNCARRSFVRPLKGQHITAAHALGGLAITALG
jgi:hypothetical protein